MSLDGKNPSTGGTKAAIVAAQAVPALAHSSRARAAACRDRNRLGGWREHR
jgi:hypothetical protein